VAVESARSSDVVRRRMALYDFHCHEFLQIGQQRLL
jgi:hypothetical protein